MPKKGASSGGLVWAVLDASELKELDDILKGHNRIVTKLRQRRLRSVPRTQFLGDLIFSALSEKAWPSDDEARPGDVRVKLRLPWGAIEELESWCEAENARRQRWGQETIPRQQVIGGLVRRWLRAEQRQRTTGLTTSGLWAEGKSLPAPVLVPAPVAAALINAERDRYWIRWQRMLEEEQQRRLDEILWNQLNQDEWTVWFSKHDTVRTVLGLVTTPKGCNPNLLRQGWLQPRLRVAGWRGR